MMYGDLTQVDLRGANLRGADLTGARIAGAMFSGAVLDGANLANVVGVPADSPDLHFPDSLGGDPLSVRGCLEAGHALE